MTTIEFFHDAVCGWCYLLSPRLRQMAKEYDVTIVHRAYVLQRNDDEIAKRFGSLELAKNEILWHWQQCKSQAEDPGRINIEGMRAANFTYPSGFNAALAMKTAEVIEGQSGHWRYFDAVQNAHLKMAKNIADTEVLLDIAELLGFSRLEFKELMELESTVYAVEHDIATARNLGVRSVPSMLINGKRLISQTLTLDQLRALFYQLGIAPKAKSKALVNDQHHYNFK